MRLVKFDFSHLYAGFFRSVQQGRDRTCPAKTGGAEPLLPFSINLSWAQRVVMSRVAAP
jgi:hypothetical protein